MGGLRGCRLYSSGVWSVIYLVSKGEIIANQPNISFSCLRLEPGSRWVSWVVGLLGGTQGRRTQSLGPLSLGPSGRPWGPGGPSTLNSNVIFHSH